MNRDEALQQAETLRDQVALLRPMQIDSPTYKLWLGDVVELVEGVWGNRSPEMARIVAALRENPTLPAEAGAEMRFLARLNRLHVALTEYVAKLASDG